MQKTGEVRKDHTPCDICSDPATLIVGNKARCSAHSDTVKSASVGAREVPSLKSFTEPLEEA